MKKLVVFLSLFLAMNSYSQNNTGSFGINKKNCIPFKQKKKLDILNSFKQKIEFNCNQIAIVYYNVDLDIDVRLKQIKELRKTYKRYIEIYNKYSKHYNLPQKTLDIYGLKRIYSEKDFDCIPGD